MRWARPSEPFVVLQRLYGRDLGVQGVDVVLAGEAEDLVDAEFDGRMFKVRGGSKR